MTAISRNSLYPINPPIEASMENGVSASLKILIVLVAAAAAAALGFWLAGLMGATMSAIAAGIVAWIAAPTSSDQSNPLALSSNQEADLTSQLQEGLQTNSTLISKIEELLPTIKTQQPHEEIEWLSNPHGDTRVFRLLTPGVGDFVFKMNLETNSRILRNDELMNGSQQIEDRFQNTLKGQQICQDHNLDLLFIPKLERFYVTDARGKKHPVIAEQALTLSPDAAQKSLYRSCASGLDQAVQQLAFFIIHMHFNDVAPRNIPILDDAPTFLGNRRIALIDLECTASAEEGIKGSANGSPGLVHCLFSQDQIDAVLKIAVENNVITHQRANELKVKRTEELNLDLQLAEFHQNHGLIDNPLKPWEVDVDQLELDLELVAPERKRYGIVFAPAVTMRQVAEDVIAEIKRLIGENANLDGSTQEKRSILLDVNKEGPIRLHASRGLHLIPPSISYKNTDLWIRKIIDALVAKGHLFQLIKQNGYGYYIQA